MTCSSRSGGSVCQSAIPPLVTQSGWQVRNCLLRIVIQPISLAGCVTPLVHLASIVKDAGDLDTALVYCRRSLDLRDELGYRLLRPLSLLAIGDVLQAQGQEAEAEKLYQSARALCETMELPLAQMETLLSLGSAKQKNGDREEARR